MLALTSRLARVMLVLAALAIILVLHFHLSNTGVWSPPSLFGSVAVAPARNLTSRLEELLNRPVANAEVWRPANIRNCPGDVYERNPSFMHQGRFRSAWDAVGELEVRQLRAGVVRYLEDIVASGKLEQNLKAPTERGILMTAGNGRSVRSAVVLLRLLRNNHLCTLPVEIYHYPGELQSAEERAALEGLGATLTEVPADHIVNRGFEIKPYAFINTRFNQFLYIDSDSLPVRNPEDLFDSVEFTDPRNGASVWWADSFKPHAENAIWRILGRPCEDRIWSFETGHFVLDKRGNNGLNLAALHVVHHMMKAGDPWLKISYGDKDLFQYAWMLLDLPFAMAPWQHSGIARAHYAPGSNLCEHTILHHGLTPPSQAHNATYHGLPTFAHFTRLEKLLPIFSKNEPLFVYLRRLARDRLDDPASVRMKRGHGSSCPFNTLWGATAEDEHEDRLGDGQFIIQEDAQAAFGGVLATFEADWRAVGGW